MVWERAIAGQPQLQLLLELSIPMDHAIKLEASAYPRCCGLLPRLLCLIRLGLCRWPGPFLGPYFATAKCQVSGK